MRTLTKQNIIDLLYGCTILSTGGGGSLAAGLKLMNEDFEAGRELKLVDVKEIPDDAHIVTVYGCGAPSAVGAGAEGKYSHLPRTKGASVQLAFQGLEEFMGVKFAALSATELGGANTAEALHLACLLGIPIADADPVGRSVPELQHSTYYIKGLPIYPIGVASDFGESFVIKNVVDDFRAEDIVRSISVACDNWVGVADHPTTGAIYRQSVIQGSLSYALKLGEIWRESRAQGKNAPLAIIEAAEGKLLFTGEVTEAPWSCVDGFDIGDIKIQGDGSFQGDRYKIWFKNENLISYRNDTPDVSCPDLICVFDHEGVPLTNPDIKPGTKVTVIGLPANEIWKTKEGLECFGPQSFGFDITYRPL